MFVFVVVVVAVAVAVMAVRARAFGQGTASCTCSTDRKSQISYFEGGFTVLVYLTYSVNIEGVRCEETRGSR